MKRLTRLGEEGFFVGWEVIGLLAIGAIITLSIGTPLAKKTFKENCTKPTEVVQILTSTEGIGDTQPQIITPLPRVQASQEQASPVNPNIFTPGTANPFIQPQKAPELPQEPGVFNNRYGSGNPIDESAVIYESNCYIWRPGVTSGSCTCHNSEWTNVYNITITQQKTKNSPYGVKFLFKKETEESK